MIAVVPISISTSYTKVTFIAIIPSFGGFYIFNKSVGYPSGFIILPNISECQEVNNMKTTITKILDIAQSKGVTHQDICRLLNSNKSKIDDWKRGVSKPTLLEITVIAKYFNVSTDYLLGITDDPNNKPAVSIDELTADERTILKLIRSFPPDQLPLAKDQLIILHKALSVRDADEEKK